MDKMNTTYQDTITSFVLNTILHHVGKLWIIKTHEQLKYYTDKHNSDCITGGPWYNTYICKKIHGNVFEEFIRNARTDRYNIMCSIDAYEKKSIRTLWWKQRWWLSTTIKFNNISISIAQCNHRFCWLLATSLKTKFARTLPYVYSCYENIVSENPI